MNKYLLAHIIFNLLKRFFIFTLTVLAETLINTLFAPFIPSIQNAEIQSWHWLTQRKPDFMYIPWGWIAFYLCLLLTLFVVALYLFIHFLFPRWGKKDDTPTRTLFGPNPHAGKP